MSIIYFLHGKSAHPFDIISVYLLGLVSGLLVLYRQEPIEMYDWVLGFIAADTLGGIVSHSTESTRQQWREQTGCTECRRGGPRGEYPGGQGYCQAVSMVQTKWFDDRIIS